MSTRSWLGSFMTVLLLTISIAGCASRTPRANDILDATLDREGAKGVACDRLKIHSLVRQGATPTANGLRAKGDRMLNCPGFLEEAYQSALPEKKRVIAESVAIHLRDAYHSNIDVLQTAFMMRNRSLGGQILNVVIDELEHYGSLFWLLLRDSESRCAKGADRFCPLKSELLILQEQTRYQAEVRRGRILKENLEPGASESLLSLIDLMYEPLLKEGTKPGSRLLPPTGTVL